MNEEQILIADEVLECMNDDGYFTEDGIKEYDIPNMPIEYQRLIALFFEKGFNAGMDCYQAMY